MLTKEQKVKLILDINDGLLPKKTALIFIDHSMVVIYEKEYCINEVFFTEKEFNKVMEYLDSSGIRKMIVYSLEMVSKLEEILLHI